MRRLETASKTIFLKRSRTKLYLYPGICGSLFHFYCSIPIYGQNILLHKQLLITALSGNDIHPTFSRKCETLMGNKRVFNSSTLHKRNTMNKYQN